MTLPSTYRALWIEEQPDGTFKRSIATLPLENLPENEVLIRVHFAGLNYKDALSATGHKGITRKFPHTPGVDAAGWVAHSTSDSFQEGQEVLVTGYDLGMNTFGGFSEYVRVPAEWIIPLPEGINLREAMVLGTAAFTAGLSLTKMERMGQNPSQGPVLVTGASGGVGSMAVAILALAGYEVIASTGSKDAHEFLKSLGASTIIDREEANDNSGRPLLRSRWAGAIDTVGGNTLVTAVKACSRKGSIAACGLVASHEIQMTVYPFLLNGINLLGVDSAETDRPLRLEVWKKLSGDWRIPQIDRLGELCSLEEISATQIDRILAGNTRGRVVAKLA